MAKIKCDLHVHLDNNITEDAVLNVLGTAEKNNVKAISLLEHNELHLYKDNGVLEKLIKSGELNNYYSGKLVSGCEISCTINNVPLSRTGFNYNNYDIHVTMLDFDIEKAEKIKWFTKKYKNKMFKKDIKTVSKILKDLGLEYPKKNYYKLDRYIGKQVYEFMTETPERLQAYQNVLGVYANASEFVRVLIEEPDGKLFYKQNRIPFLTDVIEYANQIKAKLFISHPYYMNKKFIPFDYLECLLNIKSNVKNPFTGIEVPYFLNSAFETEQLQNFAISHNLEMSGGTDFQYYVSEQNPEGKMYFINNGTKEYFVPVPGIMYRQLKETGNGDLMINKNFINELSDIRIQERYIK